MLGQRVLTATVGGALFVIVLWQGGFWWTGLWTFLAGIGAFEYARMVRGAGYSLPMAFFIVAAAGVAFSGYSWAGGVPTWLAFTVWQLLALVFFGLPIVHEAYDFRSSAVAVAGLMYVGWLAAAIVALAAFGRGALLGFWLTVWLTDIGAYFGGRFFGRNKLIPRISPGKTREGALVGTLVAVIGLWLLAPWLADLGGFPRGWATVVIAVIVSVVGQCGDLVESVLKRHTGVKDSGQLLPGHGGVLDRFDSALFAAPVAILLLNVFAP